MMDRVRNPADRFGQNGRDAGVHSRWHLGKGIQKSGCRLCFPPDGIPPLPVTGPPTPQQVQQDSYDRQLWRDRVIEIAGTGAPVETAARVMESPLQFFVGQVQAEFGRSWLELQETSRYKVLIDLQVGSIAAARKGSWKPLLMLESQGLMPAFGKTREESHKGYADEVSKMSDEEIDTRLRAFIRKRGIEGFVLPPTLSLVDPTPEEKAKIDAGDFCLKPPVNDWQREDVEPLLSSQTGLESELVKVEEPLPPVTAVMDIPDGTGISTGAVARPRSGLKDYVLGRQR
jgi:hypothetical protein